MRDAWTLQQDLSQLLKLALPDDADPAAEPTPFRALLAKAGGAADFAVLEKRLKAVRTAARAAFREVVKG